MVLGGLVVSGGDVVVCANVAKMKKKKKSSVSCILVRLTTRNGFETVRFLFVIFTKKDIRQQ